MLVCQQASYLLEGFGRSESSDQMLYCLLRCAAGAHCRMTNVEIGEHVTCESTLVCHQSQNDQLVFSRKVLVCILSVVKKMLLEPFSPLFHCGL